MVARPLTVVSLSLLAVLNGCAGGPDVASGPPIEPGRRTLVRYVQFGTGQAFSLQNASSGKREDVYSDPQRDRMVKVVSDGELQALLDIFADQGMFGQAAAVASTDARECLVVESPERRWVWTRPRNGGPLDNAFGDARAYFLALYNTSVAYHGSEKEPPPDLAGQKDRIQRDAAAAREKLLKLGRSR
ncbi:MAG: hypothetical protein RL398_2406 [Planctomycetota bacterium]